MPALGLAILLLICAATGAAAHGGGKAGPAWTGDPWILLPLLGFGLIYARGLFRLWRRSRHDLHRLAWRAAFGVAGWLSLCAALLSPLHWLGERLFTFHMIEHEIVMAISAPLLVAARPLAALLWGLPLTAARAGRGVVTSRRSRALWRWMTNGTNATILHAIAIWGWHVPALFDAAVNTVALHRLQHLSFLVTAVFFWWSVLWRSSRGVATWHLFATMMHTALLGALMALAPRILYTAQTRAAADWGMTALEDQQLAGLIMWIPAGTIYAGAALAMAALWIKHSSRGEMVGDHASP
jgi:cytochrome c oxidase assembly factor CtaG